MVKRPPAGGATWFIQPVPLCSYELWDGKQTKLAHPIKTEKSEWSKNDF